MARRIKRRYYSDDPASPIVFEPGQLGPKHRNWKIYGPVLGVGVVLTGGLAWVLLAFHRANTVLAGAGPVDPNAFAAALPSEGQQYAGVILAAAQATGVDPFILAGIVHRETDFGMATRPVGPGGTGDWTPRPWLQAKLGYDMPPDGQGWGRGLAQIDYWHEKSWLDSNDWTDPYTNLIKACKLLKSKAAYLARRAITGDLLLRGAIAAYNAGESNVYRAISNGADPDSVTAGGIYGNHDYAAAVLGSAQQYAAAAGTTVAAALPA